MELTVFGARGSMPVCGNAYNIFGHDTSCYCIKDGEKALIIDCGSGLVRALDVLSDCTEIDVVLSHVHYDHCMGLFEAGDFFIKRNCDFYGTFSRWDKEGTDEAKSRKQNGIKALLHLQNKNTRFAPLIDLKYHICGNIHDIIPKEKYELKTGFTVSFRESLHQNGTSMIDIQKDGKRICFSADYEHQYGSGIIKWTKNCDLLIFDGSYSDEDYVRFMGWGHSKFEDGCKIAKSAEVKKLLITHFAPLYDDEMLLANEKKARSLFSNTDFARQFETYTV